MLFVWLPQVPAAASAAIRLVVVYFAAADSAAACCSFRKCRTLSQPLPQKVDLVLFV